MECKLLENASKRREEFMLIEDAEYRFAGRVALRYNNPNPFIIVETLGFRFYTQAPRTTLQPKRGNWIRGEGTLLLDYGDWYVHGLGPPSLLFNFRVANIWKVRIPERYIERGEGRLGHPSYLRPADYERDDRQQVDTMVGEPVDELFYIVELDDTGLSNVALRPTIGQSKI